MENDKITCYELTMTTQNPSADRRGYFRTLQEAEKCRDYWDAVVKADKEYYGEVEFDITDEVFYFGKEYFQ